MTEHQKQQDPRVGDIIFGPNPTCMECETGQMERSIMPVKHKNNEILVPVWICKDCGTIAQRIEEQVEVVDDAE